ncbi:MAG: hypothetical protein HFJ89_04890 [Oscillospiraceae bacterium]|nr:hypothetical protein [Oscillospiraceae bacterium]
MILYTGFKGRHNSSCRLMDLFEGEKLLLTNSFAGLKIDIESITAVYNAVFMFGLDKNLSDSVRIEKYAEKDGARLAGLSCEKAARKAFEAEGIKCTVSENTSQYLCNEAYFFMLEKTGGKALFFHIPPIRYMTDSMAQSVVRAVNSTAIGVIDCDTQGGR